MNPPSTSPESGNIIAHAASSYEAGDTGAAIGKLLQDAGKLKPKDMERILKLQHEQNIRFGEAAIKLGLVTEADIQYALSFQFEYPYLSSNQQGLSQELTTAISPFTKEAETLRGVRSQLLLRWFQSARKSLAISCSRSGDGASYLAANLAVAFAQLGQKTLLIDADMREPRQHKIFNLGNSKGLTDILAGRADASVISTIKTFPTLSVLPSGSPPPNPAELLARPEFSELLKGFDGSSYDIILIDTPPSQHVSDVQAIAARTGGVLLAVRRNNSRLAELTELKEQITATGAEIVGAVVLD
jgi:protein-tyrosine kinase